MGTRLKMRRTAVAADVDVTGENLRARKPKRMKIAVDAAADVSSTMTRLKMRRTAVAADVDVAGENLRARKPKRMKIAVDVSSTMRRLKVRRPKMSRSKMRKTAVAADVDVAGENLRLSNQLRRLSLKLSE